MPSRRRNKTQGRKAVERIDNQDGSTLVPIPGGEFSMGTDPADAQQMAEEYGWRVTRFQDESPHHTVRLDPYYINQYRYCRPIRPLVQERTPSRQCWEDPFTGHRRLSA